MAGITPQPCHCKLGDCINDLILKPFYFCQGEERKNAQQLPGVDTEDWED